MNPAASPKAPKPPNILPISGISKLLNKFVIPFNSPVNVFKISRFANPIIPPIISLIAQEGTLIIFGA